MRNKAEKAPKEVAEVLRSFLFLSFHHNINISITILQNLVNL